MKISYAFSCALVLLAISSLKPSTAVKAAESEHTSPLSCVREAYTDNRTLTFQSDCSVQAHVFYYASSRIYGGLHVAPDSTERTGYSESQIEAAGGLTYYACPEGYVPVDGNDEMVTMRRVARYRCRR